MLFLQQFFSSNNQEWINPFNIYTRHRSDLERYKLAVQRGTPPVIVDNYGFPTCKKCSCQHPRH